MVKHGYSPIQRDSSPRVEADPVHQDGQTELAAAQSDQPAKAADQPAKAADRHTPSGGTNRVCCDLTQNQISQVFFALCRLSHLIISFQSLPFGLPMFIGGAINGQ